jgi:hypothetical protein
MDKYRYIGKDGGREIVHQWADGYVEGCGWKDAFWILKDGELKEDAI